MFAIIRSYTDGECDLLDLEYGNTIRRTKAQLKKLAQQVEIIGYSADGIVQAQQVTEVLEDNDSNIIATNNGRYYKCEPTYMETKVYYTVESHREYERLYAGERHIAHYINGAKHFEKEEAYKVCARMNKKNTAYCNWYVNRHIGNEVCIYEMEERQHE